MKRLLPALAIALAAASAAQAHPRPRDESPRAGAVLATSPTEIRITFSEGLVGAFSGLELKDARGKPVALGPSTVDPKTKKTLEAPLRGRLSGGTYTVAWHAVGDDTHHVSGSYSFKVK